VLKLNLGCGLNRLGPEYVNVDKVAAASPDVCHDLEVFPWPWATGEVTEAVFNHSLEHMGGHPAVFVQIMQELYRVCADGATVTITVPHPRHDHFLGDPTHVRVVTPEVLSLFSQANCRRWAEEGAANSPLAFYANVDFELVHRRYGLDQPFSGQLERGEVTAEQVDEAILYRNNIVREIRMTLKVIKP